MGPNNECWSKVGWATGKRSIFLNVGKEKEVPCTFLNSSGLPSKLMWGRLTVQNDQLYHGSIYCASRRLGEKSRSWAKEKGLDVGWGGRCGFDSHVQEGSSHGDGKVSVGEINICKGIFNRTWIKQALLVAPRWSHLLLIKLQLFVITSPLLEWVLHLNSF